MNETKIINFHPTPKKQIETVLKVTAQRRTK